MALPNFNESLAYGQQGESVIARYIRTRYRAHVLPVYEKEIPTGKGPRLFGPGKELIAPDMQAFNEWGVVWVEAKHKTHFTWRYLTRHWQTGIDLRHYEDYLRVAATTPWPLWLLFLHRNDSPKRNHPSMPDRCPTGLFGGEITELRLHEDHRDAHDRPWGEVPMVYWNVEDLHRLASLEEVLMPVLHPRIAGRPVP